jgi:hypothetical protein
MAALLAVWGANPCLGTVWNDPPGDLLDMTAIPALDLIGVHARFGPGALGIELFFDPLTTAPEDLLLLSGYLDLDTDMDFSTGRGQSHIEEFAPDGPPPLMGVDYYIEVFPGAGIADLWHVLPEFEQYVASCPIELNGTSLKVRIPRCGPAPCEGMVVGARFGFAALIGNLNGALTDRIPDDVMPCLAVPAPGDFDEDGDVDEVDLGHFVACHQGPGCIPDDPSCQSADLDEDGDVDQDDFGVFQRNLTGPG